ncbi:hypothetical protein [Rugosimonospora africana]|nr:hypothetical protein [Rugosimonospora africana]
MGTTQPALMVFGADQIAGGNPYGGARFGQGAGPVAAERRPGPG